jgi:hypothetical protein
VQHFKNEFGSDYFMDLKGQPRGSQEEAGAARRGRRSQGGLEQPGPAKWPGGTKYLQMSILNYKSARFSKGI